MYLCLVMLFAFLECNFLYRIKKTYTLFACICEQFREKQSNKFGLKSLKIYTMEYYSAIKKNTFESVLMRWLKLEPIIQSEVSQKEKHKYSILRHIYGI